MSVATPPAAPAVPAVPAYEPADAPAEDRIAGEVKWFDVKKGFGFIVGPDGQDVFVHFSAIESDGFRTLRDGERVDYELQHGDKGYHAAHVRRAPRRDADDRRPERPVGEFRRREEPADPDDGLPCLRNVDGYVG